MEADKGLLPPEREMRGGARKDGRTWLNWMFWIAQSGVQWWEMSEAYDPWQSVYVRFAKWRRDGPQAAIFHALSTDMDTENFSTDSTCIKSTNGGGKQWIKRLDAPGAN